MKKINFLFILIFFFGQNHLANSVTQPEKIYPLARVSKSLDYYESQAELWREITEKNPSNAEAWFNYYQAARYTNMFSTTEKPFDLNALVAKSQTAIPNTFELNYMTYLNKGLDESAFEDLMKAYEIGGDRPEIFLSMINYHIVSGNQEGVREFCEKWYESGDYSPGMMKWNYNMLQSIEPNAILITWGDNDSYPAWTLQNVNQEQSNVLVWSIWLLNGFQDYQDKVFEKADIPSMEDSNEGNHLLNIIEHITQNSKRPVYFAPSLPQNVRNHFESNLYWTGLVYKHSVAPFDNMAVIKNNFENKFLKDYLMINFEKDISKELVYNMNLNYLPPFLRLYRHYKESGEIEKSNKLKKTILFIAEKGGKKEDIETYFSALSPKTPINSSLNVRELDKNFVKLEGNLYAGTTEVTNEAYENFLVDLLKNKDFDKLERAKALKVNWRDLLPEKDINISDSELFTNGHPSLDRAPVVNISHEGAKLYCKWITDVYNNSNHKKKLYKRVLFRLPNEREWILTAKGGHDATYPWGGYEYTNAKGCYLFNSNVSDEAPCIDCKVQFKSNDGGFFPVLADAYFPNNYGCYNMSGNVAEMIDSKGVAMGGSWADKPDDCQVTSSQKYEERSPKVGFRVYMVVLEY